MSLGSPILKARIPQSVLHEVEITIARRNIFTRNAPWTISAFIVSAIKEKIAKMERSRRPRKAAAVDPGEGSLC